MRQLDRGRVLILVAVALPIALLGGLTLRLARPAASAGQRLSRASVGEAWSQFVSRRLHATIARRGDAIVISAAAGRERLPIVLPLDTPVEADCDTLNRSGSLIFRPPGRVLSVPIFGAGTPPAPPTLDPGRHDAAAISLSDQLCLQILDEAKAEMAPRPDLAAGPGPPAIGPVHPSADRSAGR